MVTPVATSSSNDATQTLLGEGVLFEQHAEPRVSTTGGQRPHGRKPEQYGRHVTSGLDSQSEEDDDVCDTDSLASATHDIDPLEASTAVSPPGLPTAPVTAPTSMKPAPVSWRDLPRKDQLLILTLVRLAEPIVQTSISAYIYFQLESFSPGSSAADVATRAGVLQASFTALQCLTAVWWGRLADNRRWGRKNVLLVGLVGTLVSTLGFGFSRSFAAAVAFRSFGGALNGNVGVMRTVSSWEAAGGQRTSWIGSSGDDSFRLRSIG